MTGRRAAKDGEQAPAVDETGEQALAGDEVAAQTPAGDEAAAQNSAEDQAAEIARLRAEAEQTRQLIAILQAGGTTPDPEPVEVDETAVDVVMLVSITGLRDGKPWPLVGQKITLPAHEAEQYVAAGYVAKSE